MLTPELIQMIATFMARTTLKGEEVEAFQACQQALQEEFQRASRPPEEVTEDAA